MLRHRKDHIEVALFATAGAGFAFPADPDLGAVIHPGRDFYVDPPGFLFATRAPALCAGAGNGPALALATRASRHVDELAEDALLSASHFAGAVAVGASREVGSRFGAFAGTAVATFHARKLDLFFGTEDGFLEADLEAVAEVCAARRAAPPAAAALLSAKECIEDVPEAFEILEAVEALGAGAVAIHSGVAEAVVARS